MRDTLAIPRRGNPALVVFVKVDPVTGPVYAFCQDAAFPMGKIPIRQEVPPELTYLALVPEKLFGLTGGNLTAGNTVLYALFLMTLVILQAGGTGSLRKKQKAGNENGGNDDRLLCHDISSFFGLVLTGKTCREAVWLTSAGKKERLVGHLLRGFGAGVIEKGGF
jgi:hypothetical protein